MKIGIDIDGVLVDLATYQLDHGSKYFMENYQIEIKNPSGYEIRDIFNVDLEKDIEFWQHAIYDYGTTYKARTFASEIIKKLKAEGNEIIIMTARGGLNQPCTIEHAKMHELIKNWLKDNDIIYDQLYFTDEDKEITCQELGINIMVEDKVKNVVEISKNIPVICFNAPYNSHLASNNIYRVYSWYDVYNKIKELIK